MNDNRMTTDERLAALEAENALLRERLDILEQTPRIIREAAEALFAAGAQGQRQSAAEKMMTVLYSLMTGRIRLLEEKVLTPEEAAQGAEYWERALAQIGFKVNPLKLPL